MFVKTSRLLKSGGSLPFFYVTSILGHVEYSERNCASGVKSNFGKIYMEHIMH